MSDESIEFTIRKINDWNAFQKRKWIGTIAAIVPVVIGFAIALTRPARQGFSSASAIDRTSNVAKLIVTSPAFEAGGNIPKEFTGDGSSISPPIQWSGAPEGTNSYAVSIWHVPGPGSIKSYWVVYNIPSKVISLEANNLATGTIGKNDKGRREYDPMKSKGPGMKKYHITVYALTEELKLTPEIMTREKLLDAIRNITLAEGTLDFQYERNR